MKGLGMIVFVLATLFTERFAELGTRGVICYVACCIAALLLYLRADRKGAK